VADTTTVVVGAGHCGLAMSRCLADRSIEHVMLERGEVANSWRTQRWDSLRLLTPNWMTRLPGFGYHRAPAGAERHPGLIVRRRHDFDPSVCLDGLLVDRRRPRLVTTTSI
jgi:cation diffusion facilitator CzcD-associated flavoprotein CzcO